VKFSRQVPVGNYIVDFFAPELMLAIEIDGSSHDEKVDKDLKRQKELENLGIIFFRVPDVDVKQNIDGVLEGLTTFIEGLMSK
jgi:very-short-patch-repair endonuclease